MATTTPESEGKNRPANPYHPLLRLSTAEGTHLSSRIYSPTPSAQIRFVL